MPFPAFFMPMLIGAGTGALGGLLTGKDPLKGALMGGVTGGLLGSVPALGAGGVGAGAASASSAGATGLVGAGNPILGAGLGSTAATTAGVGGINLTPVPLDAPMSYSMPTTGYNEGIQLTDSGIGSAFNPTSATAGTGSIDNLGQYTTGSGYELMARQPSMFDSLYDKVSPYVNMKDLTSKALNSQFEDRPMPSPQSGRVTEGRAPQANDVMALLQSMKLPDRRRITLI